VARDSAEIGFVKNKTEWKGTDIIFEIARKGGKTELRFTHAGLVLPSSVTVAVRVHGAPW
jgi:hypothetical protein